MIRSVLSAHRHLVAILLGFFLLGSVYSTVTPLFEAPDEIQHFFHVKHIADGKGLPVLKPAGEALYGQEGGQPALYYLLGASTIFWIDTDDAESLLDYNPYVTLGVPAVEGNKNMLLHSTREAFPYHGTVLAVHLLRYLSLLCGGLTIVATYLLAREVVPGQPAVALGAAVITAFNPQFIFCNASVNNDALLTALCSLALLFAVIIAGRGPSRLRLVALGITVGLAALTKLTGLGLLAPVLIVLVIVAVRRSPRAAVEGAVVLAALVAVLAGWWYVRNWFLYQDFTGMSAFFEALGGAPGRELTWRRFVQELEGFRLSYWAVFGWFNVLASDWVYRFFDLLVLLGAIGLPLAVARAARRRENCSLAPLLVLAAWLLTVAAGYVGYNQLIDAATGRLVFPAISGISLLLAWGLTEFPPSKYRLPFVYGLGSAMFLIALVCPFLFIRPAYARPLLMAADSLDSVANQVSVSYGNRMRLLGYDLEGQAFRPGESVHVTLYWQGLAEMEKDYSVSLVLLTPSGDLVGQEDSYPGLGSFPTSQWRVGGAIADHCWVRVKPRTQAPTIAWLAVSVYYLPTMERLAAEESGQTVEQVRLTPIKIAPWAAEEYAASSPLLYDFGDQIELVGYDLATEKAYPGEALELTLYWRARRQPDADYTVFVHLTDDEGHIWAQDDGFPLRGKYPTSFWEAGEAVRDAHQLALPEDTPTGGYDLEVGLYLVPSMERLPVLDDGGQVLDNRVVVSTIAVLD